MLPFISAGGRKKAWKKEKRKGRRGRGEEEEVKNEKVGEEEKV